MKTKLSLDNDFSIYRVGIRGLFGTQTEEFYSFVDDAKERFEELLLKAKDDPNTLSDTECYDETGCEKNFTELDLDEVDETENDVFVKPLKQIAWSYGYDQSNEDGTEFNSYTDTIYMEEVFVKYIPEEEF